MDQKRPGRTQSKWKEVVNAVTNLISSLSEMDYFNVVTFTDSAKAIWRESHLAQGTSEHKAIVQERLQNFPPPEFGSSSDFSRAFDVAFELLTEACEVDLCSSREKAIIFVTDGKDTSKHDHLSLSTSQILANISNNQAKLETETKRNASIFTFSLGIDTDDSVLRQIACVNSGSWFFIRDEDDVYRTIQNYYLFYAVRESKRVVWVEPYIDDFTNRTATTVAAPVYVTGTNGLSREFLGVVGHDVFLSELGSDEAKVVQELKKQIQQAFMCDPSLDHVCQLQILRNDLAHGATCVDSFPISPSDSSRDVPPCFTDGKSFYKRFSSLVDWEEAKERCKADGGELVSIGSNAELEFVASMASEDGTWIGARRNGDDFIWIDENTSALPSTSKYWGLNQPSSLPGTAGCMTADRRGPKGNLNSTRCEYHFSFICEYQEPSRCKGDILGPQDRSESFFSVPSLSICSNKKNFAFIRKVESAVKALNTWDVICPFRKPRTDQETICCDNCMELDPLSANEDTTNEKLGEIGFPIVTSVSFLLILFIAIAGV